jgi:hypothetical protein
VQRSSCGYQLASMCRVNVSSGQCFTEQIRGQRTVDKLEVRGPVPQCLRFDLRCRKSASGRIAL